jgi:hypothetical protein
MAAFDEAHGDSPQAAPILLCFYPPIFDFRVTGCCMYTSEEQDLD